MNLFEKFGTDKKSESEGVVIDFGGGTEIIIKRAGSGNSEFKKGLQRLGRKHKNAMDEESEGSRLDLYKLFSKTVIVEWKGVKDENGKNLSFTTENAVSLFSKLPEFFKIILDRATDFKTFQNEEIEKAVKN